MSSIKCAAGWKMRKSTQHFLRRKSNPASPNGLSSSLGATRFPRSRSHSRLHRGGFTYRRRHRREEGCNQTRMLSKFPESGRKVPKFYKKTCASSSFMAPGFYRIDDEEIVIAAVIHGKRSWNRESSRRVYKICSISNPPHCLCRYSATSRRWQRSGLGSLHNRHPPSINSRASESSTLRWAISATNFAS
jgi:plasmid stabilization system protein ParE